MEDFIKKYWDNQSNTYGDSYLVSWGDKQAIELEIDVVGKYLENNDYVLDVGCANGYSTFRQLERNPTLAMIGVDFSEPMIDNAKKKLSSYDLKSSSYLSFEVGNILNLDFEDNKFDKVYTTRVLINLPTWEQQIIGLNELLRVVKIGGKVIISEGFYEPLVKLNSIRLIAGLSPLVEHDFNRYLKISRLDEFLLSKKLSFKRIDFSSVYYLGSRFIREFVTDINDYNGYSNPINEIFYKLEKDFSGGGFGIQQAYVIIKK
jgi:ubiquinone/menaquinone biosynthesis C-methylase UbiE